MTVRKRPKIIDFIAGLGGREINRKTFKEAVKQAQALENSNAAIP